MQVRLVFQLRAEEIFFLMSFRALFFARLGQDSANILFVEPPFAPSAVLYLQMLIWMALKTDPI